MESHGAESPVVEPDDVVESAGNCLDAESEEFLDYLSVERGRSARTLEAYRRDLLAYRAHLGERGVALADAGPEDVAAFASALESRGLAPASVTRMLVAVRGLHRYLASEGSVLSDPAADVEMPRLPRGLPKALSVEQVTVLMDSVAGGGAVARRDRAILEVLYGTGCRISEAVTLSLAAVDLHDGLVRLRGKGARERIAPLGRCAADALASWLAPGGRSELEPRRWARRGDAEAVFINQRGGRLTRQGMWLVVRRHGDVAGLGPLLTPHVLRHSCATHMLDGGADIRTVQEMLGHSSISTTQIYTKVSMQRLRSVYRAAHPRAVARAA